MKIDLSPRDYKLILESVEYYLTINKEDINKLSDLKMLYSLLKNVK